MGETETLLLADPPLSLLKAFLVLLTVHVIDN